MIFENWYQTKRLSLACLEIVKQVFAVLLKRGTLKQKETPVPASGFLKRA